MNISKFIQTFPGLQEAYRKQEDVDLTIITSQREFSVHKVVFKTISPYIRTAIEFALRQGSDSSKISLLAEDPQMIKIWIEAVYGIEKTLEHAADQQAMIRLLHLLQVSVPREILRSVQINSENVEEWKVLITELFGLTDLTSHYLEPYLGTSAQPQKLLIGGINVVIKIAWKKIWHPGFWDKLKPYPRVASGDTLLSITDAITVHPNKRDWVFQQGDRLYLMEGSRRVNTIRVERDPWKISYSPDGRYLAYDNGYCQGPVNFYPETNWKIQGCTPTFYKDYLITCDGSGLFIYHLPDTTMIREIYKIPSIWINQIRIFQDQLILLTNSNIGIVDTSTWQVIRRFESPIHDADMQISEQGQLIIYKRRYHKVHIMDLFGTKLAELDFGGENVLSVLPVGPYLLICLEDEVMQLWSLVDYEKIKSLSIGIRGFCMAVI